MTRQTLFLIFLLAVLPMKTLADSGWVIEENKIDLEIQPDGGLIVTERITADFQVYKHGIIRFIPVRYTAGMQQYALRFKLLEVIDENGTKYTKKLTSPDDAVRIRIGDAGKFLRGKKTYIIRYRIDRALLWEDKRVVLRWDAVGHQWGVAQDNISVAVHLPEPLSDSQLSYEAWTGYHGSTTGQYNASRATDGTILFDIDHLNARQGVTVEIWMPGTSVQRPGLFKRFSWWIVDNFIYALFPIVGILCFVAWYRRGRDFPGRGSIAVQYDSPENLTVLEVGTLLDEKMDLRDVSATIIGFAMRGLLSIQSHPGRYSFSQTDLTFRKLAEADDLKTHEAILFDGLFASMDEVKMTDLKKTYFGLLPRIRRSVYRSLTKNGYFDGNPQQVISGFLGKSIPILFFVYSMAVLLQLILVGQVFLLPLIISGGLSLAVLILTGRQMPRKTGKGRRAWEHITGLEEYLKRAEARQISAAEKVGTFERLLPFAMIFGTADKWARAFEGIYSQSPPWYYGADSESTSTEWLTDHMCSASDSMNSQLLTPPRTSGDSGDMFSSGGFSGGGFSGGGFGGGGGSSW